MESFIHEVVNYVLKCTALTSCTNMILYDNVLRMYGKDRCVMFKTLWPCPETRRTLDSDIVQSNHYHCTKLHRFFSLVHSWHMRCNATSPCSSRVSC